MSHIQRSRIVGVVTAFVTFGGLSGCGISTESSAGIQ